MVSVAILGFGTVGSGVAELLSLNASVISAKAADDIRVKYILDVRDFPESPFKHLLTNDFSVIENDPEVQVVVETIGGTGVAFDFTRRALSKGKHVVTSNKELVAKHGAELLALAEKNNLNYLFEASVGGGIPVIRPLAQCLSANRITEICGILNGTTNYILTKMIKENVSFEDALKDAQQKGYAEQNPTADVDGHDACNKICILSSLAFGSHVYPYAIPAEGIRGITLEDAEYAAGAGFAIKLLGRAVVLADGKVAIFVAPHFVPASDPLYCVEDVFNGIMITGNAVDKVMLYGRGAGKMPTASAVVADVMDVVKHLHKRRPIGWPDSAPDLTASPDALVSRRYIRLAGMKAPCPVLGQLLSRKGQPADEVALLSPAMSGAEFDEFLAALAQDARVLSVIRVL